MEIEIVEKKDNPLFQRVEIKFRADHSGEPTPKRLDVRAKLAAKLGVPEELVVIEKLASTHGRQAASGIARAYGSKDQLEGVEPKYLLRRGMPKEAKPEVEKPKPEKPKAEKPEKVEKPERPAEKPKEEKVGVGEKPSVEGEGGEEG